MFQKPTPLVEIDPSRITVKIPATCPGYTAAARLAAQGVRVMLTAVYTVAQAILAQSVDAHCIAVYLSRLRDDGRDALSLIGQMQPTLNAQHAQIEILAASMRILVEVEQVAEVGIRAVTLPLTVLEQLLESSRAMTAVAACDQAAQSLR